MTRKTVKVTALLYSCCTILDTLAFLRHWQQDGTLIFSTVCFGLAALGFGVAAVSSFLQLRRMPKDDHASTKEE